MHFKYHPTPALKLFYEFNNNNNNQQNNYLNGHAK